MRLLQAAGVVEVFASSDQGADVPEGDEDFLDDVDWVEEAVEVCADAGVGALRSVGELGVSALQLPSVPRRREGEEIPKREEHHLADDEELGDAGLEVDQVHVLGRGDDLGEYQDGDDDLLVDDDEDGGLEDDEHVHGSGLLELDVETREDAEEPEQSVSRAEEVHDLDNGADGFKAKRSPAHYVWEDLADDGEYEQ